MMHNPYALFYTLTVSPHAKGEELGVLLQSVDNLWQQKSIMQVLFIVETSDLGKKHIHGIMCLKGHSKFAKFRKHPVFQYHIRPLIPDGGWLGYMLKDNPDGVYSYRRRPNHTYVDHDNLNDLAWAHVGP